MSHRLFLLLTILALFALSIPSPGGVNAQEDEGNAKILSSFIVETHSDIGVKDEYKEPTFANLAKVYWVIGMHDLDDNNAIDNFLYINECDLYNQYFMNDIEWKKIREATRKSISMSMAGFPRQFEVLVPLKMDRYDVEKEEFSLKEETAYEKVSRIEVITPEKPQTCGGRMDVPGYPVNIILLLNRTFHLVKVPVVREVAELYIQEQKQLMDSTTYRSSYNKSLVNANEDFNRMAYLRMKITLVQFKELKRSRANTPSAAAIYTKLDGFEIYADAQKTKLLYKEDFLKKRIHRTKREDFFKDGPIIDTGEGALLE